MNESVAVNFGQGLSVVDWAVIAAYGSGMLAVGWYYSRRTKTSEDYLLGGAEHEIFDRGSFAIRHAIMRD